MKVEVIIFTHKRALLLDSLIESLIDNFININFPINIIYHYDQKHSSSYEILFKKYNTYLKIYYRKPINFEFKKLIRPINLIWYYKFKWIREYYDNFKILLEMILSNSKSKFTLLSTDDQVFYKKNVIDSDIFNLLNSDPKKNSYRLNINKSFKDENLIKEEYKIKTRQTAFKNEYLSWDSSKINENNLWSYNFNVDGTIYSTQYLYRLLNPCIYNMPTTLEGVGLWESRIRGYFNKCLSSVNRSIIGIQASNIQTTNNTPQANFDLEKMRELYECNFTINYQKYEINEDEYIFIPKNIPLKRNQQNFLLSENGKLS